MVLYFFSACLPARPAVRPTCALRHYFDREHRSGEFICNGFANSRYHEFEDMPTPGPYIAWLIRRNIHVRYIFLDRQKIRIDMNWVASHIARWTRLVMLGNDEEFTALFKTIKLCQCSSLRLKCLTLTHSSFGELTSSGLESVGRCCNLESIRLTGFVDLVDFSWLGLCIKLRRLVLYFCDSVLSLPQLWDCKQLEHVTVVRCRNLQDITSLSWCRALRHVHFDECPKLQAIENLSMLESCEFMRCASVSEITFLGNSTKLRKLSFNQNYTGMSNIVALQNCRVLQEITLSFISIDNLDALTSCTDLRHVMLSSLTGLTSIEALSHMQRLEYLKLVQCPLVADVSCLILCPQLRELFLTDSCTNLHDLSFINACPALKVLRVGHDHFIPRPLSPRGGNGQKISIIIWCRN
jgi:BspA type Leucine rich repeat region (6 copies)